MEYVYERRHPLNEGTIIGVVTEREDGVCSANLRCLPPDGGEVLITVGVFDSLSEAQRETDAAVRLLHGHDCETGCHEWPESGALKGVT